ncbi:Scaffold-type E3 ligase [Marasmius crinis-equi]|uniref:Defective in cullin neddylation protein n=1 Tax=Marasmius crinis-equi TaxID=585013 RepID=A0ABR3F422_9AGAR
MDSYRDAKRYLDKFKRVDVAVDAFYSGDLPPASTPKSNSHQPSTSKLHSLFDKYKDSDGEDITAEGTIKFCTDLDVDPEDVVLLAVAYELKSKRMAEWNKKGWTEGWKELGCDSIAAMKTVLPKLKDKLAKDKAYFRKVYLHTFDFARAEGQRSLPIESAQALWSLLIPHGLSGGALAHTQKDGDGDISMSGEEGWKEEYTDWWLEFLTEKKLKGVSKDTWSMFLDFMTTIDAKFEKYDTEEAWPSTIDDFVEWARERLRN